MSLAIRTRPREPVRRTALGAVPLVTVRPAPPFEPPYDDETVPATEGRGSFAGFLHGRDPDRDPYPGPGEPDAGAHRAPTEGPELPAELSGAPADGTPPRNVTGRHAAHRYVGLCLEVLEGFRPVGHLRRFTVPAAFESVADQLARPVARAGHQPSGEAAGRADAAAHAPRAAAGMGAPGRAGAAGGARRARPAGATNALQVTGRATLPGPSADRIRLRRMRVAEPRDGAIEAVAVLSRAGRTWALALRLEHRDDTWLCTHVEVV